MENVEGSVPEDEVLVKSAEAAANVDERNIVIVTATVTTTTVIDNVLRFTSDVNNPGCFPEELLDDNDIDEC